MTEWDQARSVEAFLTDLTQHRGIDVAYVPPYRALVTAFLSQPAGRPLDQLGVEDVEAFVAARVTLGESDNRTRAARTAATAFVQFVRSGGLIPVTPAPPQSRPAHPAPELQRTAAQPNAPAHVTMRDDLSRVLSTDAMVSAVALTLPLLLMFLGALLGLVGLIVHYAALAGAFFVILDHCAEGRPGLPHGLGDNLFRSFGRGLMVTLVGLLPPVLAAYYLGTWGLVLAAAILGVMLVPAAALAVYASQSGLAAIAPHLWLRIVARIPMEYLKVAALYVALLVGMACWNATAGVWLGLLGAFIRGPVGCLFVFAMATSLGGVVYRNRADLGM
ncbi:hypothetical protein [Enhygromyxa salina]|uniref:Uncharacterized protein n=1 Tax=Enhygromyxa salina TaxID=215803 RepID=A0A2S9YTJ9_9BACT|nr:hypothetical protein [Enhygromyxa salina]PRQ08437.1 hypothetical protein ENSA7_17220 [Enhygromyxa salina]